MRAQEDHGCSASYPEMCSSDSASLRSGARKGDHDSCADTYRAFYSDTSSQHGSSGRHIEQVGAAGSPEPDSCHPERPIIDHPSGGNGATDHRCAATHPDTATAGAGRVAER